MPLKKLLLAGLAGSSLVLTACGGADSPKSSSNTSPTPTPTTQPTSNPTPTPTAQPTPTPEPTPAQSKVEGPLDPVQDDVVDGIVVNEIGSQLPAPLNGVVACVGTSLNYLIDAPDAVLAGAEGLASGADPYDAFNGAAADAQASLERFVGALQASFVSMVDRGECSADADVAAQPGNPLGGTPLAAVGTALEDALLALQDGDGLAAFGTTIAAALNDLAFALGNALPAEVENAPVLGGLLSTIEGTVGDVADVLVAAAAYDADATAATAEGLISNLLTGLLLDSLPVGSIDAEVGSDFASQIADAIAVLSATFGDGVGTVITPLFNEGIDGVTNPLTNSDGGLLATILAGGNPLEGVLGTDFAGNGGNSTGEDVLLGLLLTTLGGTPINDLITAANGNVADGDSLLVLLGELDGLTGTDILDTVLGTAVENNGIGASLTTILQSLLGGDLLSGLLGGLF